jgi:TPR repeat protein
VTAALFLLLLPIITLAAEPNSEFNCDELSQLQTDANQHDAKAQLKLSKLYFSGRCVSQDGDEGARWIVRSAKLGYGPAEGLLSFMFYKAGHPADAADMARKAAEQGDINGEVLLAYLYKDGKGVTKDDDEAAKWAKRAAEQGHGGGQALLAGMYDDGKGVPKNYIEADKWYRLAERSGYGSNWLTLSRNICEYRMSKKDIAEAQRRADAWKPTPELKPE